MRLNVKRIIGVLFALCSVSFLFAQETNESVQSSKSFQLTADDAVRIAIESNLGLKQQKITMEQNTRKYKHTWNMFMPNISASASEAGRGALAEDPTNAATFNTQISASLALSTALGPRIKLIKSKYENGKLDYADAVRSLEKEVRTSFYNLIFLRKQADLSKESLASYKIQYDQTKIKKDNGYVPELDLLSAQVNYEDAKVKVLTSEKDYVNAVVEFINQIGLVPDGNNPVEIIGTLDDCERIANISIANDEIFDYVNKSPSIRALNASLEQTKLSKSQAINANLVPSLSISAGITPYTYTDMWVAGQTKDSNSWSASVAISIPVSNYVPTSSTWDSIKDLDDSIATLNLKLEESTRTLTTSVIEMLKNIEIYKQTLENVKLNVALARRTYEMAQEAYNRGTKDLIYLQNMKNSYDAAELKLCSQQYILITNVYALKNMLGMQISDNAE